MRQEEYVCERMKYVNPKVTLKRDILYKKSHPGNYRFHEFVRLRVLKTTIIDSICIFHVYDLEAKCEIEVRLRNMEAFYFFDDNRRTRQEIYQKTFIKKN